MGSTVTDANAVSRSIPENSAAGTDIGNPVTAKANSNYTYSHALGGTNASDFDIESSSGQIQVKSALDYETKTSYSVIVTVTAANKSQGASIQSLDPNAPGDYKVPVTINVTDVNEKPEFNDGTATSRSVAENSAAGTNVGAPVKATDQDAGASLTYSLSGTDASKFEIGSGTAQITVKSGTTLDYEAKSSYSVTVNVTDGKKADGTADTTIDDTIAVTINVTDVSEAPAKPAAPSVVQNSATPKTKLDVSWTAPDMTGKPPITDYDVQYKKSSDFTWSSHSFTGKSIRTTIGSLTEGTEYEVQVRATNDEGTSGWSDSGSAKTQDKNVNPAFSLSSATRNIAENSAENTKVGAPVTATDTENNTLYYGLTGTDADKFNIGLNDGQITVGSGTDLDYEANDLVQRDRDRERPQGLGRRGGHRNRRHGVGDHQRHRRERAAGQTGNADAEVQHHHEHHGHLDGPGRHGKAAGQGVLDQVLEEGNGLPHRLDGYHQRGADGHGSHREPPERAPAAGDGLQGRGDGRERRGLWRLVVVGDGLHAGPGLRIAAAVATAGVQPAGNTDAHAHSYGYADACPHGDTNACANRDTDARADRDTDARADRDANAINHSCCRRSANRDAYAYAHGHSNGNTNACTDGNTDAHGDSDGNTDAKAHRDADARANGNTDAYGYSDGNTDAHGHSDGNTDTNGHSDGNTIHHGCKRSAHGNADTHGYSDGNTDTDGYTDGNAYAYGHSNGNTYAHGHIQRLRPRRHPGRRLRRRPRMTRSQGSEVRPHGGLSPCPRPPTRRRRPRRTPPRQCPRPRSPRRRPQSRYP